MRTLIVIFLLLKDVMLLTQSRNLRMDMDKRIHNLAHGVKTMEYFRGSQLHPFDHTSIGLSICKELYLCFSCSLTICWYGLNLSSLFRSYSLKLASLPTKKNPIISLEETISTGWQWFTYFLQKMHSSYNIWSSIFEEQQKEQGKYRRKHMHRIQLSE